MHAWMTLWAALLAFSIGAFGLVVVVVGYGAVIELKQMLDDLRRDTAESAAHPEQLDRPT